MANPYQAVFRDDNSDTRLAGAIDFTDPANQPSAAVTTREYLGGTPLSITNGANVALPWNPKLSNDTLLDLSVPTVPTIVTAGVYTFALQVAGASLTSGGVFGAALELDVSGEDVSVGATSPPSVTAADSPNLALTLTWYLAAGAQVQCKVQNLDGASSRDFVLVAVVQRIS